MQLRLRISDLIFSFFFFFTLEHFFSSLFLILSSFIPIAISSSFFLIHIVIIIVHIRNEPRSSLCFAAALKSVSNRIIFYELIPFYDGMIVMWCDITWCTKREMPLPSSFKPKSKSSSSSSWVNNRNEKEKNHNKKFLNYISRVRFFFSSFFYSFY